MITQEQNREISDYLSTKKLPLDLYTEVKDHFIEQIEFQQDIDFASAFSNVKSAWETDLQFVWSFFNGYDFRITRFQKRTMTRVNRLVFEKILPISSAFIMLLLAVCYENQKMFLNIMTVVYWLTFAIGAFFLIKNHRLIPSSWAVYSRRISVYQRNASFASTGLLFVAVYNIWIFRDFQSRMAFSIRELMSMKFSMQAFTDCFMVFGFVVWTFYGIIFLERYRKSVQELGKRGLSPF